MTEKKPDDKTEADKELIEPEMEEVESRFPALSQVLSAEIEPALVSLGSRKEEALKLAEDMFAFLGLDTSAILAKTDWSISRGLEIDGELIGIYLLAKANDPTGRLKGRGLEGLALAIRPEFQHSGLSDILLRYTETLGFNYIWGYQDKRLNNIEFWLRTRKILMETPEFFITYRIF